MESFECFSVFRVFRGPSAFSGTISHLSVELMSKSDKNVSRSGHCERSAAIQPFKRPLMKLSGLPRRCAPDGTTGETTSHLTRLSNNDSQVIGYSHSTKPASWQVAGYRNDCLFDSGLSGLGLFK